MGNPSFVCFTPFACFARLLGSALFFKTDPCGKESLFPLKPRCSNHSRSCIGFSFGAFMSPFRGQLWLLESPTGLFCVFCCSSSLENYSISVFFFPPRPSIGVGIPIFLFWSSCRLRACKSLVFLGVLTELPWEFFHPGRQFPFPSSGDSFLTSLFAASLPFLAPALFQKNDRSSRLGGLRRSLSAFLFSFFVLVLGLIPFFEWPLDSFPLVSRSPRFFGFDTQVRHRWFFPGASGVEVVPSSRRKPLVLLRFSSFSSAFLFCPPMIVAFLD